MTLGQLRRRHPIHQVRRRDAPTPAYVPCLAPCPRRLARRRGPAPRSTQFIDQPLPLNSVPGPWPCPTWPAVSGAPRNPTQLASAASPMP